MKVILSYGNYFNHGKQYQIKFEYDNQEEVKSTKELMDKLKDTKSFNYYYLTNSSKISLRPTNIYGGTDIPKEILHPFISMFLSIKNTTVIIGNKVFNSYETNKITEAINSLHINATLSKGIYFSTNSTYYVTFKYASEEQQDELLYEFYNNLNLQDGINSQRVKEWKEHIMPFLVNRTGDITDKNANIIGGTNIPEDLLKEYIKLFIEEHNIIINVGSKQFKDKFDEQEFEEALSYIVPERAKIRKKETISIT